MSGGADILTFDIGGHGVRAAVFDFDDGSMTRQADIPAEIGFEHDAATSLRAMLANAALALNVSKTDRVVLALPGPVRAGAVRQLPTLFPNNSAVLDLCAIGRSLWREADIWVVNDLTAAGYAFVGQGHRDFFVLTCGSGIGGKQFVSAQPRLGQDGFGGEIGHWRVPGAPDVACDCGGTAHLGALASGRGVVRLAQIAAAKAPARFAASAPGEQGVEPGQVTSRQIAAGARDGDDWCYQVVDEAARYLGQALALIHLASGTSRFFVTGGFGTSMGEHFGEMIARHARCASVFSPLDWASAITVGDKTVEYGLVGAAALVRHAPPTCPARKV